MQSRSGNWIMAAGILIAVVGLSVMPAGIGEGSADRNLLGFGAVVFSMGVLAAAMGVYLKANALKAGPGKNAEERKTARPVRGGCDRCQSGTPVIQCKVHQQHLCGTCLAEHYDFRSCVYSPSTRGGSARTMAARAR